MTRQSSGWILGAVVALVVVLHDDLPVRRELVLVARPEHQGLRRVVVDREARVADPLGERLRVAARVEEEPAVPRLERHLHQREALSRDVELEARRRTQVALQAVDPGVVRAPDPALRAVLPHGEELVAAMPADVVERPERPVVTSHQQERLAPHLHRGLVARVRELEVALAPHAHPAALEEVPLLPGEDLRRAVGVAGERQRLVVGLEHSLDGCEVERRGGPDGHAG